MRFGAVATLTTFVAAGFLMGLPSCNLIETRQNVGEATGGNSGGSSSTVNTSGGAGGTKSSGGTTGSGGSVASGGSAMGGNGGAGGMSSGGNGSGGSASGGTSANGGAGAAGSPGSGGTAAGGGAGGVSASGGSTTVSNCTDTQPPGRTETCAEWVSWQMCTQSWFATYCDRSCGRCSGTSQGGAGGTARGGAGGAGGGAGGSGGVVGSGGTSNAGGSAGSGGVAGPGTTNPQITGTNGWASRYWDCCKPSCGWTGNSNPPVPSCQKDGMTRISVDAKNGCEGGGSSYECYDFSPWYDASTNMAYGFVAYNGVPCGTCFKLQFTGSGHSGSNAGAAALKGQQMIVQVVNIGGIEANQFDILVPGGGVGQMTAGCTAQWGNVDLGATWGGLLTNCKNDCNCMKGKCQSVFGNLSPLLKAGCDWFTNWYSCADNPNLVYQKVSCPSQLSNKTGLSK